MHHQWLRFDHAGKTGFGTLHGDKVREHRGDMFGACEHTGRMLALAELRLRTPTTPGKVIALWNNFHALGEKLGLSVPSEPLYLLKAPNSYLAHGEVIRKPMDDSRSVFAG